MTDEYTCSGWACTDCLMWLANGETPTEMTEAETAEWLAGIETRNAGYNLTLGMLAEDHECATNYTVTFADGTERDVHAGTPEDAQWSAECAYPAMHDIPVTSSTPHELETAEECECEQMTFTWSACDVCGSNLGGARDAVSFWKITSNSESE